MTAEHALAASGGLRVSLAPCPAPDQLACEWQALEAQVRPSFFTSWTWIGCWLAQVAAPETGLRPSLVRVHRGHELVGLGVVVPQRTRRLRGWPSRALHVHATGLAAWDDITIEHNGWLAPADLAVAVDQAVAAQLWALVPDVDQIRLQGVSAGREPWRGLQAGVEAGPGMGPVCEVREVREEHSQPAYRVDLAELRASGQAYLDRLGPPTRAAIRRSLRLYETRGAVRLEVAATVDEGLHFLGRLKHFHQAAWRARGRPGAFANPRFERFHDQLVRTGLPAGQVQLLRLMAGPDEVGYLYNFVQAGQVLAYQSGFHFGLTDRNHHPGLVTHALAVQQALVSGGQSYDFLAGQARYKQQLASHCYAMTTYTLHRASLGWRLERVWRAWRDRGAATGLARS